jgi:hypothetical protein
MRLRLHAPRTHGEVLAVPGFDSVPALVDANRRLLDRAEIRIDGVLLRELREQARRELAVPDGPVLVGGHQPELSHPGVWAKNFALNGLARRLSATPLHLVVDSDTPKHAALRIPNLGDGDAESVTLESLPFDRITGTPTFEDYTIQDAATFTSFLPQLRERTATWPFEPLAWEVWPKLDVQENLGEQFTRLRQHHEREWGCENREIKVSTLSQSAVFRTFARHIAGDLPRFHDAYNGAIREFRQVNRVRSRTHPAPELERREDQFEAPFWVAAPGGRSRLFLRTGESLPEAIRPRALTLTLFARLVLGDFFLHGIGGGKYDEVTDAIIRNYFGIEAPAYQVVSATLHLPLPAFPAHDRELDRARRAFRDLQWNPQRHVVPPSSDDPYVMRLVADRETLASSEPMSRTRAARRAWYRRLTDLNEQLRHHVWKQLPPAKANLARCEAEVRANAILQRRDYSWLLYPRSTLQPFLRQFLGS